MLKLIAAALVFTFFVFGCTPKIQSSLLTDASGCSGSGCSQDSTAITGSLSILPDTGEIVAPIETTDLIEVSGNCQDLGRKNNQILVEVFEGENDAVTPIIDNSIGFTCQDNISTSSLRSVSGTGQTCLLVSQGIGLAESGQVLPQYPQCFNGRFSFMVRLGRIIRQDNFINDQNESTNPIQNYLVKMKLRTTEGVIADSGPSTLIVRRKLTTPFFSVTSVPDSHRCEIKLRHPAKFRDIRYTLFGTWIGPSHGASGTTFTNTVSSTIYLSRVPEFPPLDDGTTIENFWHVTGPPEINGGSFETDNTMSLMPGIKYKYKMKAEDFSYISDYVNQFTTGTTFVDSPGAVVNGALVSGTIVGSVETSGFTPELECNIAAPRVVSNQFFQATKTCSLQIAGANNRYSIEWRVSDIGPQWVTTNPNDGKLVNSDSCRASSMCNVTSGTTVVSGTPLTGGKDYFFAARQYVDLNSNNQADLGEFVGDWSPVTMDERGNSFMHLCNFDRTN